MYNVQIKMTVVMTLQLKHKLIGNIPDIPLSITSILDSKKSYYNKEL